MYVHSAHCTVLYNQVIISIAAIRSGDSSLHYHRYLHQVPNECGVVGLCTLNMSTMYKCSVCIYMLHHLHHTAVIPPPQLTGFTRLDSVARFTLGPVTAERSERYISSLEHTDLGVPLEVEFEEAQSTGAVGDTIDRNVSAPRAEYNVQIWSINGASFSYDPVTFAITLLFDKGKETASIDMQIMLVLCARKYSISLSQFSSTNVIQIIKLLLYSMHSPLCSSTAVCHPHPL